MAKEYGLDSKRAWGSDGRSLGLDAEVDIVIEDFTAQCKVEKGNCRMVENRHSWRKQDTSNW